MGKYPKSIVTDDLSVCACCGKRPTEIHHVFGGRNRKLSTEYGLVVGLCHKHHQDHHNGVHGLNKELDDELKANAQKKLMERYKLTTEEFIILFGKNYI